MTGISAPAVLGLDVGGTSTRAVVIDRSGRRVGWGKAGGGNLSSHDRDAALDAVFAAITAALTEASSSAIGYSDIGYAVVGTAGAGHFRRSDSAAEFARRWSAAGLSCPYDIESDAVVAFVAGTDQPDGTLILSGTGALASAMVDRSMTTTIDGHGWLVGDVGSAFWLGREAVIHTLYSYDVGLPPSPLARGVLAHYGISERPRPAPREIQAEIEVAIHRDAPVNLSRVAPLVTSLVDADPAAARIVAEAADHLLRAASTVRPPDDATPIVLAGSLLTTDNPVATAVRDRLGRRWPDASIGVARAGAGAAAWLALLRGGIVGTDDAARAHARAIAPEAATD